MKKYAKLIKVMTAVLAVVIIFSSSSMMTAHAAILYPGMKLMEDGRISS